MNSNALSLAKILGIFCVLNLVLHGLYINTPFINLEFIFDDLARFFVDPSFPNGFDAYFYRQANPIGYSVLSAPLLKLLSPWLQFAPIRILSLVGIFLILWSGKIFFDSLKVVDQAKHADRFVLWCSLTSLCPLIWTYAGRGTPDVLPAGLTLLSLAIIYRQGSVWLASVLFSLACFVKLNSALMAPAFVAILYFQRSHWKHFIVRTACLGFPVLATVVAYLAYTYARFGFIVMPDKFKRLVDFYWSSHMQVFSLYIYFLFALAGPLILCLLPNLKRSQINNNRKYFFISLAAALGIALISIATPDNILSGEMSFGFLDRYLPAFGIVLIKLAASLAFGLWLFHVMRQIQSNPELKMMLMSLTFACLIYIFFSAVTRPTQRYLIYCLPLVFLVYTITVETQVKCNRWVFYATLVFFGLVDVGMSSLQVQRAYAAYKMTNWVVENNILTQTDPGPLLVHDGSRYLPYFDELLMVKRPYAITLKPGSNIIHEEKVELLGKSLGSYYLIKR